MNELTVYPKFRTRYDIPMKVQLDCTNKERPTGRTKQSFAEDADINNIMKKYQTHGVLPDMIRMDPTYGDYSEVTTYQESLNIVIHAQEQFNNLSAELRARFNNEPAKFLEFTNDPGNAQELIDLGLATAREQAPQKGEPVAPVTAPEEPSSSSEAK